MALTKGSRIGPYEILEPLSRGGMAQIYRARQDGGRKEVAVKVNLQDDHKNPTNKNALRREVDILTRLTHHGVPRILPIPLKQVREQPYMAREHTLLGQPWYYVMEYLQGGSLAGLLKQHGCLQFNLASVIGAKLTETLRYIHSMGIAHMDIKPENVLMRSPLAPKSMIEPVLIDFGVAAQTRQVTATGGTLITMAPEYILKVRGQLKGNGMVDLEKADIYSLGVVVYRMWTGKFPFDSRNEHSLTSAILNDQPRLPRTIKPDLPPQADKLMTDWLAKDPVLRPSLDEIRVRLDYMTAGLRHAPENVGVSKKTTRKSIWPFGSKS